MFEYMYQFGARDISKVPIGWRVVEDAKESSKHGMEVFGLYDKNWSSVRHAWWLG